MPDKFSWLCFAACVLRKSDSVGFFMLLCGFCGNKLEINLVYTPQMLFCLRTLSQAHDETALSDFVLQSPIDVPILA